MTYFEKLKQDHPEMFDANGKMIKARFCPGQYGYPDPDHCEFMNCDDCWNRKFASSSIQWISADNKSMGPEVDKSYLCTLKRLSDGHVFWDKVEYLDYGWKIPGTVKVVAWCDPILYGE